MSVTVDGIIQEDKMITLINDGVEHNVRIEIMKELVTLDNKKEV